MMAAPVLNAQVVKRDKLRTVQIGSAPRYRDPLQPYISTDEISFPAPGGPLYGRVRVVLPDATTDHVNAVALQFQDVSDVDALILILTDVRRRLAERYPTEGEMEEPF